MSESRQWFAILGLGALVRSSSPVRMKPTAQPAPSFRSVGRGTCPRFGPGSGARFVPLTSVRGLNAAP